MPPSALSRAVLASEEPFKGKIFDYKISKPYFKEWSAGFKKSTDGKSLGNIRTMDNVAAGKITSLRFDDRNRTIEVAAKIVDEAVWCKIEDGVYTGLVASAVDMSASGPTADYQRYTAEPDSVLISDFAKPHSSFTLIKADGTSVLRKFNRSQERFRPMSVAATNDMIFKLAHEIAEGLGEPFGGHHIERARKRLALQDHVDTMAKATPQKPDETLPRRARAAELSHAFGKGDQSRRVEFGDISLKLGDGNALDGHRVMVTHDQAADEIVIQGHAIPLHRIDSEVRGAFYVASAAFLSHLQDQQEQIQARSLIELVVNAIAQRHDDFVGAEVRRRVQAQRYQV